MPRDSTGTYSLPSGTLVNTGDTILVSQHNPFAQDVEQALSGSLSRDGSGGMRSNLAMGNNKITGLAPGVDDTDAATVAQLGDSIAVPLGAVVDYWGATPPTGFLFCYGQEVSRTDYAALFAIIGTGAGAGNGSTTFNLPDYRGRVGAGKDNMGGTSAARLNTLSSTTLGTAGGSQTHTLTTAQMPAHTHSGTTDNATTYGIGEVSPVNYFGSDALYQPEAQQHNHTFTTSSAGGGEAHNNIQPTIICNKIMRVS